MILFLCQKITFHDQNITPPRSKKNPQLNNKYQIITTINSTIDKIDQQDAILFKRKKKESANAWNQIPPNSSIQLEPIVSK